MTLSQHYRTLLISSVLLLLSACSKAPLPLPDPGPIALTPAEVSVLYGVSAPDIALWDSQKQRLNPGGRRLNVRLLTPAAAGQYPLVVFSHGNWSHQFEYEVLLQHLARHGYAVLSLDHDDCCGMARGILAALRYGNLRLIEQRVWDIALLLNHSTAIDAMLPPGVTLDHDRVALSGHSFGAYTAQLFAGATVFDKKQQQQRPVTYTLERPAAIKAIVAISPPGPMFKEITEESWQQINKPMLATTGTWDVEPRFFPDYQLHLMSHYSAPAGSQYGLIIQGADHYFGNLICRTDREQPPQHLQLQLLKSATMAFLDHYVKQQAAAGDFLDDNQLTVTTQGFAKLMIK